MAKKLKSFESLVEKCLLAIDSAEILKVRIQSKSYFSLIYPRRHCQVADRERQSKVTTVKVGEDLLTATVEA